MFDYEIRQSAENKRYEERSLSEHLSMSRADRPDEWLMDEFILMAKKLEAMCEANSNAVLADVIPIEEWGDKTGLKQALETHLEYGDDIVRLALISFRQYLRDNFS